MTITLTNFLSELNKQIDDDISSTTTANGNAGGTTAVDSSLSKYPDNYFGDPNRDPEWWFYSGTTLKPIKDFVSNTGTIVLYSAFGSQVASSTAYSIHRYDRDKKKAAINSALYDAYPYFYKRVEDNTTLDGKGASDNQYTISSTMGFTDFPDQIWKQHTGDTTTLFTRTLITDYTYEYIGGAWNFYANISTSDDIYLVGKTYLSQLSTDAGTTELDTQQARCVALKAAEILYSRMANTVNATDAGRYEALASRFRSLWDRDKEIYRMPVLATKLDFGWMDE